MVPMGWLGSIMRDVERFVDDVLSNTSFRIWSGFDGDFLTVPAVNIKESDTEYTIEVASPGMSKDDFIVEVQDDILVIKGEKKEEKKEENERFTRREFNFARFERRFTLPEDVIIDEISGEYKDGILYLHLPKRKESKKEEARKIEIK